MSRRRRILGIGSSSDGGDSHGEKPWVYFMVDCFFLITQFFLIGFHTKEQMGWQLVRTTPPGGKPSIVTTPTTDEILNVHLSEHDGQSILLFQKQTTSFPEFAAALARVASSGKTFRVNLSYDGNVEYKKVVDVMNECSRLRIEKCSLVPLRADESAAH